MMTMSRYSFFFFILVASTPAVLAQDTEQVGDWTVRQTQGADRSRAVSMTLVPDNMEAQGIHMFAFRCSANLLALVVTHSYMAGDDNRVQIRYQLGMLRNSVSVLGLNLEIKYRFTSGLVNLNSRLFEVTRGSPYSFEIHTKPTE